MKSNLVEREFVYHGTALLCQQLGHDEHGVAEEGQ